MIDDPSGDVGQCDCLRRRGLRLRLSQALRWLWPTARGKACSNPSWRYFSAMRGAIFRRLGTWPAGAHSAVRLSLASERMAKLVALLKKGVPRKNTEGRHSWRSGVAWADDCCQRVWMLARAQFRAGIGRWQNWRASNRFPSMLKGWVKWFKRQAFILRHAQNQRDLIFIASFRGRRSNQEGLLPTQGLRNKWPALVRYI